MPDKIMRVSYETAERLREIKDCLVSEVKRDGGGNDVKGVYDRVVSLLTTDANEGEDIAIAKGYGGRIPYHDEERYFNRQRFTPEVIEEVAYAELARHLHELMGKRIDGPCNVYHLRLKEQIGKCAERIAKELSEKKARLGWRAFLSYQEGLQCWYFALDRVAEEVSNHWGTPFESC